MCNQTAGVSLDTRPLLVGIILASWLSGNEHLYTNSATDLVWLRGAGFQSAVVLCITMSVISILAWNFGSVKLTLMEWISTLMPSITFSVKPYLEGALELRVGGGGGDGGVCVCVCVCGVLV